MYFTFRLIEDFCAQLKMDEKAKAYRAKANEILRTLNELLWDPLERMWFDWDMLNHIRRRFFYASNLVPLWAEAYPPEKKNRIGKDAVLYLLRMGVTTCKGGIPASLYQTSQQWDWNAWPPLQHMIVSGLNKTKNQHALKLAFQIARNYTLAILNSCTDGSDTCKIFEKYNPVEVGAAGKGGEYEVQLGFGWTNGVLIDFIDTYGDDLVENETYVPRGVKEVKEARCSPGRS